MASLLLRCGGRWRGLRATGAPARAGGSFAASGRALSSFSEALERSEGRERELEASQRPSEAYKVRVERGELAHDRAQWQVARKFLDKLHSRLDGYALPQLPDPDEVVGAGKEGSAKEEKTPSQQEAPQPVAVMVPRGLYVHGSVGTGKSMLMDLFFRGANVERKRRVHFNKFMLEVHARLQRLKARQLQEFGRQRNIDLDPRKDAISLVADEIADESHLLCFDEFQVTDVADALIMRKLFGVFFRRGVVVVATSNTPPSQLYHDGINREYFVPFLDELSRHARVVDMNSETDYRLLAEPFELETFLYPLTPETQQKLDAIYAELLAEEADASVLSGANYTQDEILRVPVMMGRWLDIRGSKQAGVCRATFNELCNTEKGAADYKSLSECFHTLVLSDVPTLSLSEHDQMRRFILLIDELYEHHTRLICSSASPVEAIFAFDNEEDSEWLDAAASVSAEETSAAEKQREIEREQGVPPASSWDGPVRAYNPAKMAGLQVQNLCAMRDLRVAFHRAVSRLREMQSARYIRDSARIASTRKQQLATVLREVGRKE